MTFQHVLGIAKHPGGLELCTRLLENLLFGDWIRVSTIACCETGGFTFASPLAEKVKKPIAMIREAGKLPPPKISVTKSASHISASTPSAIKEQVIEMEMYLIPRDSLVVVVDDVLATGRTLCAVLELLRKAGVRQQDIIVLVVAEFPAHRGRKLLYERGFGWVNIRNLLVFGGA
jgi:adenine/guanine phosphoribosyltransferase-like PRPP-binding protein